MNDIERIFKLVTCMGVSINGKDKDGDRIFIEIEGETAQSILLCLQQAVAAEKRMVEAQQIKDRG